MNREHAAVLCRVANSWLKLVAQHTDSPPGEAVRAALTALALEAPEAAADCKALMAFLPPWLSEALAHVRAPGRSSYTQVHKEANALLPYECSVADSTCHGRLHVAFRHDAPPEYVRRDQATGCDYYDGPCLIAGYRRLCGSHHKRYDRVTTYALVAEPHVTAGRFVASQTAQWLTPAEAGELLRLTAGGVRAALRRGSLVGRRDERGWLVSGASVERYRGPVRT